MGTGIALLVQSANQHQRAKVKTWLISLYIMKVLLHSITLVGILIIGTQQMQAFFIVAFNRYSVRLGAVDTGESRYVLQLFTYDW